MRKRLRLHTGLAVVVSAAAMWLVASASCVAFSLKTRDGSSYQDCEVMSVESESLVIAHAGGVARIPYDQLPESFQRKHFDAGKVAAARKQREDAARLAASEMQARKEEMQRRAEEEARAIRRRAEDGARAVAVADEQKEAQSREAKEREARAEAEAREAATRKRRSEEEAAAEKVWVDRWAGRLTAALGICVGLLPFLIAGWRKHGSAGAILVLCGVAFFAPVLHHLGSRVSDPVFLVSILAWIVALLWSCVK